MTKILSKLLLIITLLAFGFSCFYGGILWYKSQLPISSELAITTLEKARDLHQFYADNPELVWWGTSYDAEWVERYDAIIQLLKDQAMTGIDVEVIVRSEEVSDEQSLQNKW